MRCDKCMKKFAEDWVPGKNAPRYQINECIGIGDNAPVSLCYKCSQLFMEWLDEQSGEDEGFGR